MYVGDIAVMFLYTQVSVSPMITEHDGPNILPGLTAVRWFLDRSVYDCIIMAPHVTDIIAAAFEDKYLTV